MKKTMMYLPEEMHRYLTREGAERGVSMAEIAREAIAEYRARRAADSDTGVSAILGVLTDADPATDLALRVDETLDAYYAEGGAWDQDAGSAHAR